MNFYAYRLMIHDEATRYQMGRYISSNKAIRHIFTFHIQERDPAVVHLAVYLENGQCVYFTELTALQQAITAPKTALTEFFVIDKMLLVDSQIH